LGSSTQRPEKKKKVETTVTAQFESPGYYGDRGYIVGSVHTDPNVRRCLEREIDVITNFSAGQPKARSGADGSFRIGPLFVVPEETYHVFAEPKKVRNKNCKPGVTTIYGPPFPY